MAALTRSITSGIGRPGEPDPHIYDKVEAIEGWMADHIKYTTDIPPLPAGADAVTSFLFGTRLGYCEQISTATVVMLRSLGIPARETVGYVPGSYDPITDLYEVQAKDAHAWVQVWFPGYGWQSFDPTADVPLANPSPGSVLARTAGRVLAHLPWIPIGIVAAVTVVFVEVRRRRLRRPPTWAHQIAADLERGGARLGRRRRVNETLSAYGVRLAAGDDRYGAGLIGVNPTGGALHLRRDRALGGADPRRAGLRPRLPHGAAPRPAGRRASRSRQGQRLVERRPGGQQGPVGHQLAGPAEGQRRPQPVAPPVEGHQLPLLHRALDHHHLVVRAGQADHLDLGLVLVGPEERNRDRRAGRSADPASRLRAAAAPPSAALVQCSTRSMLAGAGLGPPGHVAGGDHVVGGEEGLGARPPRCRWSGPSRPATRRRGPRRCPPPPGPPRGRSRRPGGPRAAPVRRDAR